VAGGFTTEHATAFDQRLVHVTVTDVAAHERNLQVGEGLLHAVVAHQRADHRAMQAAFGLPRAGQDVQQVIAVDRIALVVGHQHAVAVTIEGDAEIGAGLADLGRQVVDVGGPRRR
jgi:hypothetical protein